MGRRAYRKKHGLPRNTRALRNYVWFKLHGTAAAVPCFWCGKPLRFKESTLDHEPPLSMGGKPDQAVISCNPCNQERGLRLRRASTIYHRIRRMGYEPRF